MSTEANDENTPLLIFSSLPKSESRLHRKASLRISTRVDIEGHRRASLTHIHSVQGHWRVSLDHIHSVQFFQSNILAAEESADLSHSEIFQV